MANAMLEEDFKSSHPDLVSMNTCSDNDNNNNSKRNNNNTTMNVNEERATTTLMKPKAHLPTRKSVDFALLPPPSKRHKPNVPWTAKQVIDALSSSITPEERVEAIQKAKDSFHHDVQAVHDDELTTGADAAMTKHLTFLLYHYQNSLNKKESSRPSNNDQSTLRMEISLACDAMESLYRASSSIVGESFKRMGNELLELLVVIINDELNQRRLDSLAITTADARIDGNFGESPSPTSSTNEVRQVRRQDVDEGIDNNDDGDDNEDSEMPPIKVEQQHTTTEHHHHSNINSPSSEPKSSRSITPTTGLLDPAKVAEGDLMLRKSTKILGHFARVGEATKPMAHYPGLIGCLVNLIAMRPYECVPWEARLSALWTIANLACNSENMQMMVCSPNLVAALIDVACRPLHSSAAVESTMEVLRSRSIASRALLNLSWAPENKILLAENAALINLLAELTIFRTAPLNRSRTVQEILLTTRRHAVGALRNLAAAPRRVKIGLCNYNNGHILDVLTDAALNDPDSAVKDRAFATIHNLAIHDTAEKIVNHPALVLALKDVLLSSQEEDDGQGQQEIQQVTEGTPRQHASATLMVLERTITPEMDSYENLRGLLDAINPTNESNEENEDDEITNEAAV